MSASLRSESLTNSFNAALGMLRSITYLLPTRSTIQVEDEARRPWTCRAISHGRESKSQAREIVVDLRGLANGEDDGDRANDQTAAECEHDQHPDGEAGQLYYALAE